MLQSRIVEDNENWLLLTFPELTEFVTLHRYFQGVKDRYWIMFFQAPDGGHLGYRVMHCYRFGNVWTEKTRYINPFQEIHYNESARSASGIYRNPSLDSYVERSSPGYREPGQAKSTGADRE